MKRLRKVKTFQCVWWTYNNYTQLPQPNKEFKVIRKEHTRTSLDHSHTKKVLEYSMRHIDLIFFAWFVWLRCMVITN